LIANYNALAKARAVTRRHRGSCQSDRQSGAQFRGRDEFAPLSAPAAIMKNGGRRHVREAPTRNADVAVAGCIAHRQSKLSPDARRAVDGFSCGACKMPARIRVDWSRGGGDDGGNHHLGFAEDEPAKWPNAAGCNIGCCSPMYAGFTGAEQSSIRMS